MCHAWITYAIFQGHYIKLNYLLLKKLAYPLFSHSNNLTLSKFQQFFSYKVEYPHIANLSKDVEYDFCRTSLTFLDFYNFVTYFSWELGPQWVQGSRAFWKWPLTSTSNSIILKQYLNYWDEKFITYSIMVIEMVNNIYPCQLPPEKYGSFGSNITFNHLISVLC